jgi:hypothetical protein
VGEVDGVGVVDEVVPVLTPATEVTHRLSVLVHREGDVFERRPVAALLKAAVERGVLFRRRLILALDVRDAGALSYGSLKDAASGPER